MNAWAQRQQEVGEIFTHETRDHEMTVLRDDGLYRHLRFGRPGDSFYQHDLITWPGYLAIVGDAGDFVFRRESDMFGWFGEDATRINPEYWSQKLQAPEPRAVRMYTPNELRAHVRGWYESVIEGYDLAYAMGLWFALDAQVLSRDLDHEDEARELLRDFEFDPGVGHIIVQIADSWEWEMWEFSHHFLWCCWAIIVGIARYRDAATTNPSRDPCPRTLVGAGDDVSDPVCGLLSGHEGPCTP